MPVQRLYTSLYQGDVFADSRFWHWLDDIMYLSKLIETEYCCHSKAVIIVNITKMTEKWP